MFGFPKNNSSSKDLAGFPNENLTDRSPKGFPYNNPIWTAVKSGNWNDPSIWNRGGYPANAVPSALSTSVVIPRSINVAANLTTTVNNLSVFGTLTNGSCVLSVLGRFYCPGYLNMSASIMTLDLYGNYNYINPNKFTTSSGSLIRYQGSSSNQEILGLTYGTLTITGGTTVTKSLIGDVITLGQLTVSSVTFQLQDKALTVGGICFLTSTGRLLKNQQAGKVTFKGVLIVNPSDNNNFLDFSAGNPDLEFQNGWSWQGVWNNSNFGAGNLVFSTNSQTLINNTAQTLSCASITVQGAITVTNTLAASSLGLSIIAPINGTVSGSTFNNNGIISQNGASAALGMMTTGVFNYMNGGAGTRINYYGSDNYTLPYPTYTNVGVGGGGSTIHKSLGMDTTISGGLIINTGGFQLGAYSLSVGGNTQMTGVGAALRKNSSTGAVLLIGALFSNPADNNHLIDFTAGNPDVEFRGGISFGGITNIQSGSGTMKFSTNAQSITVATTSSFKNVLISGPITVTNNSGSVLNIPTTLDGDNAASKLDNRGTVNYAGTTAFPTNGVLECGIAFNTFNYNGGNQNVKAINYYALSLNGGGITKTASGDIRTFSNLAVGNDTNSTLQLGGNQLIVDGNFTCTRSFTVAKNVNDGKTTIIKGQISTDNGNSGNAPVIFNLGTNDLEVRNGISSVANTTWIIGKLILSTNTQTFNFYSTTNLSVLISGAIIVTSTGIWTTGNLDGDNAGSTFRNSTGTLILTSSTLPMSTAGVYAPFYTGAATVYFQFSGDYTIPSVYYPMGSVRLSAGGIKKISQDTTMGNFSTIPSGSATLDMDAYSLDIQGTCSLLFSNSIIKSTNDGKQLTIRGVLSGDSGSGGTVPTVINIGSSTMELRAGAPTWSGGTNVNWTMAKILCTTANQTINVNNPNTVDLEIQGPITVTNGTSGILRINELTCTNAASTLDNRGTIYYYSVNTPLTIGTTGALQTNAAINTFRYSKLGNQNVKGTIYRNLNLEGSGDKIQQGNISVINTYTLTALATRNSNGFTFGNP